MTDIKAEVFQDKAKDLQGLSSAFSSPTWENSDYFARIKEAKESHINAVEAFFTEIPETLVEVSKLCANALRSGNKILLCGNGGSASDAQHISGELVGRLKEERIPLAAIALSTDTSVLTCIGNDYGYDEIYSRQVAGLGQSGDILFAISTSGNSENIIRAVKAAREKNMHVVGVMGKSGGKMLGMTDYDFHVKTESTAHIQECHIMVLHLMCEFIEKELGLT